MKSLIVSLMTATGLLAAGVAHADDQLPLATAKGCMACHDIGAKKVGPAYTEVAKKYAGQKDAEAKLADKVKKGGQGVWGQVPMPPNAAVPEADIKTLVKWILSTK